MSRHGPVGHECDARAIIPAMPECSLRESAELKRAIHFRVSEGFVAAVAPAEAPEDADVEHDLLLEVHLEAVFMAALSARRGDVGWGRLVAGQILVDGLAVVAHVRVVEVAEQAHGTGTID